jgi:hypothetical protein
MVKLIEWRWDSWGLEQASRIEAVESLKIVGIQVMNITHHGDGGLGQPVAFGIPQASPMDRAPIQPFPLMSHLPNREKVRQTIRSCQFYESLHKMFAQKILPI